MATEADGAVSGLTAVSSEYEEIEVEVTDSEGEGEEEEEEELEEVEYEEVEVEEEEEQEDDASAGGKDEVLDDTEGGAAGEEDTGSPQGAEIAPSSAPPVAVPAQDPPVPGEDKTAGEEGGAAVMAAEETPASPLPITVSQPAAQESPPPADLEGSQTVEPLKEVEAKTVEATTKAAADLSASFMSMGTKLTSAFTSVSQSVSSAETATTADKTLKGAQESVNKLVGGISNWWSSIDTTMGAQQSKEDDTASKVSGASQASAELQKLFGLPDHENLVESFKCKLLQTYSCNHNTVTPAIQMAFQGTLYITDRHTCFTVEERGRKLPSQVLHADIVKVERQRPARKGDLSDVLRIQLSKDDTWMAFKDFGNSGDLDSALALLEHLTE